MGAWRSSWIASREPPQLLASLWIECVHLPREVSQGEIPVIVDERFDVRTCPRLTVIVAAHHGRVEVGLAHTATLQDLLVVQPGDARHVSGVGTGFGDAYGDGL